MKFKKNKKYNINKDAGDIEKSIEMFNNSTECMSEGLDKLNYTIDTNRVYDILDKHRDLMRNLE